MIVIESVFEKSAPDLKDAPREPIPEICFVGRSNVGKSSALNTLTRRKQLARVSKTPGRTRLLNFFRVEVADRPGPNRRTATLRLCDLPGYGYAEAPKSERKTWGSMITAYLDGRDQLRAVVVLVDCEVGPQPRDHEMLELLSRSSRPLVVVATKADRVSRTRMGGQLDKIARELGVPRSAVLPFSSVEQTGRQDLWRTLCAAAGVLGRDESEHLLEANEGEDES